MHEHRSLFVLACEQVFAVAVVTALAVSGAGVTQLQIQPGPGSAGTVTGSPAPPAAASLVSSAPVRPTVRNVRITSGSPRAGQRLSGPSATSRRAPQRIGVLSPPEPVSGYATVGVTWDSGRYFSPTRLRIWVRTRDSGGWSRWQRAPYDPAHEPDPGADSTRVRAGTDAIVVGEVEQVQVRTVSTAGAVPAGLSLALVDPGRDTTSRRQRPAIDTGRLPSATSPAPEAAGASGARLAATSTAPQPQIFSRAQWGADESLRDPASLRYGTIRAGFVHHTADANGYTRAQVPSIIRGIYAYHVQSRGWSDIGYNFLVDRFGRIWEGRYGGVDRAVVGAHTLGYNEESFAMSAIGNFETARASDALVKAYQALFAWKLGLYGIRADDNRRWVGNRYLRAINGHRDVADTLCPGKNLYARLPEIRAGAAALQSGTSPPPPPPAYAPRTHAADLSGSAWPDLVVRDPADSHLLVVRTGGQVSFAQPTHAAAGWDGKDLLAAPGDLTGDGVADIVARARATGITSLYPGRPDGTVAAATRTYRRFAKLDQLTGAGDFDGDGAADLVGRVRGTRQLVLYPGTGDGGFGPGRVLAPDWGAYDLTSGAGDLTGDGRADLVARAGRDLFLVRGRRSGSAAPTPIPGSWGRYDLISGAGDLTGDGLGDLVVRARASGRTFIVPGNGAGGFTSRIGGFERFDGARWLAVAGQMTGGRRPDLVTMSPSGRLHVAANSERRNLGRTFDTGVVLDDTDLLLNVGDWNGDGIGDVMTRQASSGDLLFRAGLGGNRFAAPVVAATGWRNARQVTSVGDVNGDGNPDLMARRRNSTFVYPGNGRAGFGPRLDGAKPLAGTISADTSGYDWLLGPVDADGDGRGDVIARAAATGALWLLPGRRSGYGERRLIGTGFDRYDLGS